MPGVEQKIPKLALKGQKIWLGATRSRNFNNEIIHQTHGEWYGFIFM
jgi:hypothetical protein